LNGYKPWKKFCDLLTLTFNGLLKKDWGFALLLPVPRDLLFNNVPIEAQSSSVRDAKNIN
jgi:hypothetical protein